MNTVGTGSGISGSSGDKYNIVNTSVSTRLISNVYDQTVSNITIDSVMKYYRISGIATDYASDGGAETWGRAYAVYKNDMYIIDIINYEQTLQKITFDINNEGDIIRTTEISTPFRISGDMRMIQLGDYLYLYATSSSSTYKDLYRFDGTTFTEITKEKIHNYFFGKGLYHDANGSSNYMKYLRITPCNSTQYDGTLCVVDVFDMYQGSWDSGNYPEGMIGIFGVDDSGFHLKSFYHVLSGPNGGISTYNPHLSSDCIFVSDYIYMRVVPVNKDFYLKKYKINFTRVDESGYTKSYTELTSKKLWGVTSTVYESYAMFHRLSYPEYDTFILTLDSKAASSSQTFSRCKWLNVKVTDNDLTYSNINVNGSTYSSPNHITLCPIVSTNVPYMFEFIYPSYMYIQRISVDSSYNSERSRFQYYGKLRKGDTIYCDDGIISCTKDGLDTIIVNSSKYMIPSDGLYTIITHTYDAYTFPSIIITDTNKNIVYMRVENNDDESITGYFINGMSVNGIKVTESKKALYGPSDRYLIAFK